VGVGWRQSWEVPAKGSIFKARARLGREPLQLLFEAVAGPLAGESTRGAFYRGLRLLSVDGTCLDVATLRRTMRSSAGPGRVVVKVSVRSRSCGWSRSQKPARTRSARRFGAVSHRRERVGGRAARRDQRGDVVSC